MANTPKSLADMAEKKRKAGQLRAAIELFQQADELCLQTLTGPIYPAEARSFLAWVRTRRGMARVALGEQNADFVADFDKAIEIAPDYTPAYIQKGEACRVYVGNLTPGLAAETAVNLAFMAINSFKEANRRQKTAWTCAHLGAAYTLLVWIGSSHGSWESLTEVFGWAPPDPEKQPLDEFIADRTADFFNDANKAFEEALALDPSYAWAAAFHAFLHLLHAGKGDVAIAERHMGTALLYDPRRRVRFRREFCFLYSFRGNTTKAANEKLAYFKKSIQMGEQALDEDPDDYIARYFVAVSQKKQAIAQEGDQETANIMMRRARVEIMKIERRAKAMRLGLRLLEGGKNQVLAELKQMAKDKERFDMDTSAWIKRDPAWELGWDDKDIEKVLKQLVEDPFNDKTWLT